MGGDVFGKAEKEGRDEEHHQAGEQGAARAEAVREDADGIGGDDDAEGVGGEERADLDGSGAQSDGALREEGNDQAVEQGIQPDCHEDDDANSQRTHAIGDHTCPLVS